MGSSLDNMHPASGRLQNLDATEASRTFGMTLSLGVPELKEG